METFGHVQVELRIKAMQPVLIPGPVQTVLSIFKAGPGISHLLPRPRSVAIGGWSLSGQGKGPSFKRQASSLTGDKLDDIGIYRRNYENK